MERIRLIAAIVFVIIMFFRVLLHFKRAKIEDALTEEWVSEPARIIMEYVEEKGATPDINNVLTGIAENLKTLNKHFMKYDFTSVDVSESLLTLSENIVVRALNYQEYKTYEDDTTAVSEALMMTLFEMVKLDNEESGIGETDTTRILKIVHKLSEEINKTKVYYNAMHISFDEK